MYEIIYFKLKMSQLNQLFLRKTNNSSSPMACGDHVAVVAVDIGSAFSGYAYQYRTDYLKNPTENITCPLWIEKNNKATGKTASSLLLNPDGSFNSFG